MAHGRGTLPWRGRGSSCSWKCPSERSSVRRRSARGNACAWLARIIEATDLRLDFFAMTTPLACLWLLVEEYFVTCAACWTLKRIVRCLGQSRNPGFHVTLREPGYVRGAVQELGKTVSR